MARINANETFNAGISTITDFKDRLKQKLKLIANYEKVKEIDPTLTLEDIRVPMFVTGGSGIGKTASTYSVVKEINSTIEKEEDKFAVMNIKIGQTLVGEFSSIAMVVNNEIVAYNTPLLPVMDKDKEIKDPETGKMIPNPKYHKRGVLFLDELTSSNTEQVQPVLGLCDETRSANEYKLPEEWLVVAAGNGPDDRNFVRFDDMAVRRFEVFEILDINFRRDYRDVYLKKNISTEVIAFLDSHPEFISEDNSDPEGIAGNKRAESSTWEMFHRYLKTEITSIKLDAALEGKPINAKVILDNEEIKKAAERSVGPNAADTYINYLFAHEKSNLSEEDILSGKAKLPASLPVDVLNYYIESTMKVIREKYQLNNDQLNDEILDNIINYIKFFMAKTDAFLLSLIALATDIPESRELIVDDNSTLNTKCPELGDKFLTLTQQDANGDSIITAEDIEYFQEVMAGNM